MTAFGISVGSSTHQLSLGSIFLFVFKTEKEDETRLFVFQIANQ